MAYRRLSAWHTGVSWGVILTLALSNTRVLFADESCGLGQTVAELRRQSEAETQHLARNIRRRLVTAERARIRARGGNVHTDEWIVPPIRRLFRALEDLRDGMRQASREINARTGVVQGRQMAEMPTEVLQAFDRIHQNPRADLSPDDYQLLLSSGYLSHAERYRRSARWVRRLNRQAASWYRSQPLPQRRNILLRALVGAYRFLFIGMDDPTRVLVRGIFRKIAQDPDYILTPNEAARVRTLGFADDLERVRTDARAFPGEFVRLSSIRTRTGQVLWIVALTGVAAGMLLGEAHITSDESLDEDHPRGMSRYDERVELIFLSPMPHASIRIGGVVYNYGIFNVDRYTLDEFREMTGFGETLSGSHTRVELNLTPDERARLRDILEGDVGTVYPLFIPYNDCVSMTNRAVAEATGMDVPAVMDRSQAGSILYYKLQHLLNPERVPRITYASSGTTSRTLETGVNILDSMLFLRSGPTVWVGAPLLDSIDTTYLPESQQTGEMSVEDRAE